MFTLMRSMLPPATTVSAHIVVESVGCGGGGGGGTPFVEIERLNPTPWPAPCVTVIASPLQKINCPARVVFSVYCPGGTAVNVKLPPPSVLAVAVSMFETS